MIDPLCPKRREFLAVMGLADEDLRSNGAVRHGERVENLLAALTGQNAFAIEASAGRRDLPRFHHMMMKECALHTFLSMPKGGRRTQAARHLVWIIGCICMP